MEIIYRTNSQKKSQNHKKGQMSEKGYSLSVRQHAVLAVREQSFENPLLEFDPSTQGDLLGYQDSLDTVSYEFVTISMNFDIIIPLV